MTPLLRGLAGNPALPVELVDRLIALADPDLDDALAFRDDLGLAQAITPTARDEAAGVRFAYEGTLTAAEVDLTAQPRIALALLDDGTGDPAWARLLAASADAGLRQRPAAGAGRLLRRLARIHPPRHPVGGPGEPGHTGGGGRWPRRPSVGAAAPGAPGRPGRSTDVHLIFFRGCPVLQGGEESKLLRSRATGGVSPPGRKTVLGRRVDLR